MVTHYLVKWKSLPYEDATWELEVYTIPLYMLVSVLSCSVWYLQEDIDTESIATFNRRQMIPPPRELAVSVHSTILAVVYTCHTHQSLSVVCAPASSSLIQTNERVAGVQGWKFPKVISERGS